MSALPKLYHIAAFGFYLFVLHNLQRSRLSDDEADKITVIKNMRRFSGRFLTNWTFTIQTLYFGCCLVNYFLAIISISGSVRGKLERFANFLFTAIATPMALMVTVVFWTLYIIDRELIFPKEIDLVMPAWVNHSIHTFNSAIAIGEMYVVNHSFPSWGKATKGLLMYLVPYSFCLFGTFFHEGIWLYPFLGLLDWPTRIIASIATLFGALFFFGVTKAMGNMLWAGAPPPQSGKSKKQKQKSKKN